MLLLSGKGRHAIYIYIYISMFIITRSSLTIVKRCEMQIQGIAHIC